MPRQAYKRTSRGKNARRKSEFILCGEIRQDFFLFFSWLLCCTKNKLLLIHFFVSDFFSIPAGIDKNVRSKWFCPVRRTSVRRGAKTLAEKVNLFFAEKSVRISSYFFLGFSAALKTNYYLFTFSFRTFLASPITHTRDRSMPYKSFSSLSKLRSVLRL